MKNETIFFNDKIIHKIIDRIDKIIELTVICNKKILEINFRFPIFEKLDIIINYA
jgi:hypothetical protein